jgi:glycosyltransferase involved in cell wall biosynthesis
MLLTTEAPAAPVTSAAATVSLSLVMPVLNEEANLSRALDRVVAALERLAHVFEVIVVDDGSTDATSTIAAARAVADRRIRVLRNPTPHNYGIALQQGIAAARCEWILHDPADLPLAPEDVVLFVPHLAAADVVVARRTSRSAHTPWRKLTSWTNHCLLRLLFRPQVADLNFVQFYRRAWVQPLHVHSTSPAFVTPELILRAEQTGRVVHEVPVGFRRREAGRAHFGKPRDILWTLTDMLRFRLRTWLRGWDA